MMTKMPITPPMTRKMAPITNRGMCQSNRRNSVQTVGTRKKGKFVMRIRVNSTMKFPHQNSKGMPGTVQAVKPVERTV